MKEAYHVMAVRSHHGQYVIQRHSYGGFDHFDLMFEWPRMEKLRTFQLPDAPTREALARGISAREIVPHRREYLAYEGEVSGNRGSVAIWGKGFASTVSVSPERFEAALTDVLTMTTINVYFFFTGGTDWYLFTPNAVSARTY